MSEQADLCEVQGTLQFNAVEERSGSTEDVPFAQKLKVFEDKASTRGNDIGTLQPRKTSICVDGNYNITPGCEALCEVAVSGMIRDNNWKIGRAHSRKGIGVGSIAPGFIRPLILSAGIVVSVKEYEKRIWRRI